MSDQQSDSRETDGTDERAPKVEAVQAVVDRIVSWQDGAPEDTVRDELTTALGEAGLDVPATFVDAVVTRVRESTEHFDVEPLLTEAESRR